MNSKATLLTSAVLDDFPSGSGINYYHDQLFLIGDDATSIVVLDTVYAVQEVVTIFDHSEKRIPKSEKVDFETSTILRRDGIDYLCVIGSGSKKRRAVVLLMPLQRSGSRTFEMTDYLDFRKRLESKDIEELNIEGSTIISDRFILANRSNHTHRQNYLIVTSTKFWEHQVDFSIVPLVLPDMVEKPLGVSELCYVESHDLLFVALSLEDTSNAIDDGAIGDSYIGWITSIREKINSNDVMLDGLINLSEVDAAFVQQKIEGICVERAEGNEFILHLVSDNDLGESRLFKVRLVIA